MGRPKGSLNKNREPDVPLVCEHCGEGFTVRPWLIRQNEKRGRSPRRFCSAVCSRRGTIDQRKRVGPENHNWAGGVGSYRERAIAAFGAACQICGYDKEPSLLWVHHKDFGRSNHQLENLEVLCIRCHLEKHLEHDRESLQVG